MLAAALSQKSQSGRISGESASRYTAAPRAAAVRYARSCSETTVPTSAEQAAEQPAAPGLRRILIGQRVDAAIHVQLAAIQA